MKIRNGFSLIELVVVILVLGILAAVAVPRLFSAGETAKDNGLRQTLHVVRNAIDLYTSDHDGAFPGASDGTEATFKSDIHPYLARPFPRAPVGTAEGDDQVNMKGLGTPLSGNTTPSKAWKYDYTTGEFILNFNGISNDGTTSYEDF